MNNFEHCAALVRETDRDRYLATLFAPPDKRDALFALYAFNVEIGRVRDVAREPMPGEIRLQWWREVLEGKRDGEAAAHPVAAALRESLGRYGLLAAPLLQPLDARSFDLYDEPMATVDALELYAIQTQSPIFALASGILSNGKPQPDQFTLDASVALTIAIVLTRFGRHAARKQIYVPTDLLEKNKAVLADIYAGRSSAALLGALADMRQLARAHLAKAQARLTAVPPGIFPAFLPLATIGPTLRQMEKRGTDPFTFEPIAAWRRQWALWRAARDPQRMFAQGL